MRESNFCSVVRLAIACVKDSRVAAEVDSCSPAALVVAEDIDNRRLALAVAEDNWAPDFGAERNPSCSRLSRSLAVGCRSRSDPGRKRCGGPSRSCVCRTWAGIESDSHTASAVAVGDSRNPVVEPAGSSAVQVGCIEAVGNPLVTVDSSVAVFGPQP